MSAASNQTGGASSVSDFCRVNGIGRTTFYSEVKAGRLRAVRCGGRTLVLAEDAEIWRRSLQPINPKMTTAGLE